MSSAPGPLGFRPPAGHARAGPALRRKAALPALFALTLCAVASAQPEPAGPPQQVTVTAPSAEPVEKSYRKMLRGMDHFEKARATAAPGATLRFKLLPRKPGTDLESIKLEVIGNSFDYRVPVAADHSFVLARDPRAWQEDAVVSPNRKRLSMTWRTEIRSPGLAPGSRRLGDLRLECEVGMEAGLVSNSSPLSRLVDLFTDNKHYCQRKDARYLFFAERPLFSVTLVAGERREVLPTDQLYAAASDDPGLKDDLPYCDCEVLVDRTYFLPLGDPSWPDDTRVEFDFMDDGPGPALSAASAASAASAPSAPSAPSTTGPTSAAERAACLLSLGKSTRADVSAALGKAIVVPFDDGHEVWVYRWPGAAQTPRAAAELVLLFAPSGWLMKLRVRPGYA